MDRNENDVEIMPISSDLRVSYNQSDGTFSLNALPAASKTLNFDTKGKAALVECGIICKITPKSAENKIPATVVLTLDRDKIELGKPLQPKFHFRSPRQQITAALLARQDVIIAVPK